MEPEFWHQRWQQNQIGFHQPDINPYLRQYWSVLAVAPPARVLVPLCGKSLDLLWLTQQGYQVVGVELSALAIRALFEEQQIEAKYSQQGDWQLWETDRLQVWGGDFFTLGREQLGHIDAVYDRAALIALPPPMRQQYVEHMQTLVGAVPHLLVTMEYPQQQMSGPPFSVDQAEVAGLFSARYTGTEAPLCEDILASNPHFRERGLGRLSECVYLLQVRKK